MELNNGGNTIVIDSIILNIHLIQVPFYSIYKKECSANTNRRVDSRDLNITTEYHRGGGGGGRSVR